MSTALPDSLPDERQLQALEEKFDPEMRFQPLVQPAVALVGGLWCCCRLFTSTPPGLACCRR